jgi:hypothetical protein
MHKEYTKMVDCSVKYIDRLNMELDLHRLFGLLCTAVLKYRNPPLTPHLGSNTRVPLVSQERRHLCAAPECNMAEIANTSAPAL